MRNTRMASCLWTFTLIALLTLLSCNRGSSGSTNADTRPDRAEAQEAARRWLDALSARDSERLGSATTFPFWSFGLEPEAGAEAGTCSAGLGVSEPDALPTLTECLFKAQSLLGALASLDPKAHQGWQVIENKEIPNIFGGKFSVSPFAELSGALGRLARRNVFVAAEVPAKSGSFFLLLAVSKEEGGARVSAVIAAKGEAAP